jgi:copper oxidase (laccase) domain-containing protein
LSERERVVNNRREKIHCLDQRQSFREQIHTRVVVGVEPNEYVRISWQWQAP